MNISGLRIGCEAPTFKSQLWSCQPCGFLVAAVEGPKNIFDFQCRDYSRAGGNVECCLSEIVASYGPSFL